ERLSIWAPASAPLTDSEADARSAPRPMSTAERVTGPPAGTCPLAPGTIVRTMGGAATAEGDTAAEGLAAAAGTALGTTGDAPDDGSATATDGDGRARWRRASLAASVGGRPGAVGAALPGTAPRTGRSLAGPHAVARTSSTKARAARVIAA